MAKKISTRKKVSVRNIVLLFVAVGVLVVLSFWVGRMSYSNAQIYKMNWNQQATAIGRRAGYSPRILRGSAVYCPTRVAARVEVRTTAYYDNFIVERFTPEGWEYDETNVYGINRAGDAVKWYCTINRDKYR